MARFSLENLEVTSFVTQEAPSEPWDKVCTADISTCPRTTDPRNCQCTSRSS